MKLKDLQYFILIVLVVLAFIGAGVLDSVGYQMGDLAKSNLTKVFPAIYFLFFLLLIKLFYYPANFYKLLKYNKSLSNYLFFIVVVFFYLYAVNLASSVSFIVNTLLLPFLFFIYFKSCKRKIQTYIPVLALKFILLNSVLAITERIFKINFFPIRQTFGEQFRSTAFLGHPLNNALITFSFILFVLVIDLKNSKKIIYLFFLVLALFCYGARGSLVASLAAIILLYIIPVFISKKKYFYRTNKTVTILLLTILTVFYGYILLFTSFGERFRETSKDDGGSAQVRLDSLNLINIDNLSGIYWPISMDSSAKITENAGIEIVENFIIIWILKFGLVITIILFYFLLKFLIVNSQIQNKYYAIIVILLFLGAAATNNSLGSNTNALLLFILLFCVESKKYKFLF